MCFNQDSSSIVTEHQAAASIRDENSTSLHNDTLNKSKLALKPHTKLTNYMGCLKCNKLVVLNVCNHLYTTTNEMISTCNVTGVLVQDSMVNERLLLPILKAFTHCTHSLHTCQNARYRQTVAPSSNNPLLSQK